MHYIKSGMPSVCCIDSITSLEAAINNVPAISCGYLIIKANYVFKFCPKQDWLQTITMI